MRCFRLQVSRRRAQGFNGCLARIVERSHLDCRKPVRWTLKVGSALQCGARCRRATVSPARVLGQAPGTTIATKSHTKSHTCTFIAAEHPSHLQMGLTR